MIPTHDQEQLLGLARASIQSHLGLPHSHIDLSNLSKASHSTSGVFITLKKAGELRGCIGCIQSTDAIPDSIRIFSQKAAFEDSRFSPVTDSEIDDLTISISLLTPFRSVKSYEDILIGRHGVLLEKGNYSALFLPKIAQEQGWDRDTTLNHLAQKAGLPSDGWQADCDFQIFESIDFSEEV
ncbi:AmmeMemoRadiSam system protein A [bacterium]|jgi:AmmeMemoRadiSam system protein A|nr:AmmeMemoRadiSam system protein A [bacterium]